ncbi:hypothetical protein Droror1_Dr00027211 [Drosera rotundifolia]
MVKRRDRTVRCWPSSWWLELVVGRGWTEVIRGPVESVVVEVHLSRPEMVKSEAVVSAEDDERWCRVVDDMGSRWWYEIGTPQVTSRLGWLGSWRTTLAAVARGW